MITFSTLKKYSLEHVLQKIFFFLKERAVCLFTSFFRLKKKPRNNNALLGSNINNKFLLFFSNLFPKLIAKIIFRKIKYDEEKKNIFLYCKTIDDFFKISLFLENDNLIPLPFGKWGKQHDKWVSSFLEKHKIDISSLSLYLLDSNIVNTTSKYYQERGLSIYRISQGFVGYTGSAGNFDLSISIIPLEEPYDSGLIKLCNTYKFCDKSKYDINCAKNLIKLTRRLGVGISNSPCFSSKYGYLRDVKRNVLVIEDDDKSTGADLYKRMYDLLKAAIEENQTAKIIFYPNISPNVSCAKALQDSDLSGCFETVCNIPLLTLMKEVDHVYVLEAFAGYEALIQGVRLTIFGKPFYAGWGLTDDRQVFSERKRKLCLEELFFLTHIYCSRYRIQPANNLSGFLATVFHIVSLKNSDIKTRLISKNYTCGELVRSDYWYYSLCYTPQEAKNYLDIICEHIHNECDKRFQVILIFIVIGFFGIKEPLLKSRLNRYLTAQQWRMIEKVLKDQDYISNEELFILGIPANLLFILLLHPTELKSLVDIYENIKNTCFYGCTAKLALLLYSMHIKDSKTTLLANQIDNFFLNRNTSMSLEAILQLTSSQFSRAFWYAIKINSGFINEIGELPYEEAFLSLAKKTLLSKHQKALCYMYSGYPEFAITELEKKIFLTPKDIKLQGKCYSQLGQKNEAMACYKKLLNQPVSGNSSVYLDFLHFCIHNNHFEMANHLLKEAKKTGVSLNGMYRYYDSIIKINSGDLVRTYPDIRALPKHQQLKTFFKSKYLSKLDKKANQNKSTLVIAISGLGDEISYACHYPAIAKRIGGRVYFTCDRKLFSLFQRSYPDLIFIPVNRIRPYDYFTEMELFSKLPKHFLYEFMDNTAWNFACEADNIVHSLDATSYVVKNFHSFPKSQFLYPNVTLQYNWKNSINNFDKLKVGLCWRSGIKRFSRDQHNLKLEQLKPLFARTDISFFSLQYDGLTHQEHEWLETNFPGKIFFPDPLDMYNDIDGLAAYMSCLDIVVSPATNIRQISGALDIPTLLVYKSSALYWRKDPQTSMDRIYPKTKHISAQNNLEAITLLDQALTELVLKKVRASQKTDRKIR